MLEEGMKEEDIMFTEYPLIPIMFPTDSYLQKLSVSDLEYMIGSEPTLRHAKK
ncbi:peptide-binding protein [Bacillus pseudomycoides]|nr:peptide-binding protein [Bacillus pseudomycoides]PEM80608.1 peptide-binding protein [Bacillus pseudomycoides]PHC81299.1 peptide-binding protein [Bacillus pseudomycoides]